MANVSSSIKGVATSDHSTGLLYVVLISFIIGDFLPTPADPIFFAYSRTLREKFFLNEISPKQYWSRLAISYYAFSILWWSIVFLIVVYVPGGASDKWKVAIGIISGGVLIAVLHNLITKDEREKAAQQEKLIPKS